MDTKITRITRLEPYFSIAEKEAKQSECIRRQYGAIIVAEAPAVRFYTGVNRRMGRCCEGKICARNRFQITNGRSVEIGAEIHAEIAALINWKQDDISDWKFILAGFANGKELLGKACYPCHVCALALKYAGFRYVYIKNEDSVITPYSIARIIAERELEWEGPD